MRYCITSVLFILMMAVSVTAQLRLGYLNPQTVLDNLPEKATIERELNRFLDERESEFEQRAIEFQNLLVRYQRESPNLSAAERRRRSEELEVREQELQQFQYRVEMELQQRQAELLRPVLQEMNRIIDAIALEKNLVYVLNEATSEGEFFLLFISDQGREQFDLTDEVLSRMLN